jgi:hypothetical protein
VRNASTWASKSRASSLTCQQREPAGPHRAIRQFAMNAQLTGEHQGREPTWYSHAEAN